MNGIDVLIRTAAANGWVATTVRGGVLLLTHPTGAQVIVDYAPAGGNVTGARFTRDGRNRDATGRGITRKVQKWLEGQGATPPLD